MMPASLPTSTAFKSAFPPTPFRRRLLRMSFPTTPDGVPSVDVTDLPGWERLTVFQAAMMDYLLRWAGEPVPTLREIQEAVGHPSEEAVIRDLLALAEAGYIAWRPSRPQDIRIRGGG